MAKATIFVELDTTSVTQGSKALTTNFGNALRTVQAQANTSLPVVTQKSDELSKTLGRLSNSRAPQFMGLLTSQALASIPALQGSATAMGLAQIASFGLQRSLNTLVGAGGVILLGITALIAFAGAGKKVKDAIDPVNESLETLGQRYLKMQEVGVIATATQISIRNKIADLNKEIEELNKTTGLNAIALEKMGLANLSAADQEQLFGGVTQKLTERIERIKTELASWQKLLDEFNTKKAKEELDKFTKSLPSLAELEISEMQKTGEMEAQIFTNLTDLNRNTRLKNIKEWEIEEIRTAINITNKEKALAEKLEKDKKALQKQTIQSIASSFEDSLAEMLRGGKVAWDELLQYWYTQLIASAVLAALSKLFSFSLGGGLFTSLFNFQTGTPFVPQTGAYLLHKGEAVIPAESNPFVNQTTNNWGGNTYIINVRGEITEESIRRELLPKLKRMSEERSLIF